MAAFVRAMISSSWGTDVGVGVVAGVEVEEEAAGVSDGCTSAEEGCTDRDRLVDGGRASFSHACTNFNFLSSLSDWQRRRICSSCSFRASMTASVDMFKSFDTFEWNRIG